MSLRAEVLVLQTQPDAAADVAPEPSLSPTVYVRTLSTPSAPPWDQRRAAGLEARLGAPLPLDQVVYQVHRLKRWTFGQPGRFAACYVRAREIGDQFETAVDVDGRPLRIRFVSRAEHMRRARKTGVVAAVVAVVVLLIICAAGAALSMRLETESRLAGFEQNAAVQLRQAHRAERLNAQARLLDAAGMRNMSLASFLDDLAWASTAKAPDAHIDAVHWQRGYLGVEVRGAAEPFVHSNRMVIKSPKLLRPGVWLWGVEPLRGTGQRSSENHGSGSGGLAP